MSKTIIKHNIGDVRITNSKYSFFKLSDHIEPGIRLYFFSTIRNIGKSTDMWNRILDDYINKGRSSIIMRRRKDEVDEFKASVKKVINKVSRLYNYNFALCGNVVYDKATNNPVVELVSLATSYKAASGIHDNTYALYFDEVQSRQGGYLKNEYRCFVDYIGTIERYKDDEFIIAMFSNSLTKDNPYLATWGIWTGEKVLKDGIVKVAVIDDTDLKLPPVIDTLAYHLSKYDKNLHNYMYKGNFAFDDDSRLLFKKLALAKVWDIRLQFSYDGAKFIVYRLIDERYWVDMVDAFDDSCPVYTFNVFDNLVSCNSALSQNAEHISLMIKNEIDKKNMFFSNADVRLAIYRMLTMLLPNEE